jgi:endonuclease/exonuclease/phosphatase family metal-dependent hydrolase
MSEPSETSRGDPAASESAAPALRRRDRLAALARSVVNLSAVLYLLALLAVVGALRLIGERWWVTTIALYLPRIGFALPLPPLIVALLIARSYRLLVTQLAAALVLLFPLMGLHLGGARGATAGALRFRLFTLNIGLAKNGTGEILDRIHGANPDVIVLEEVDDDNVETLRLGLPGYSFRHLDQFVIASRFPVEEEAAPPRLWIDGWTPPAQYAHCRLITPAGPLRLFAVHPLSPHDAFDRLRGQPRGKGLWYELLSGRIFQAASARVMEQNTQERLAQVRALAADAAKSSDPVLIAGDTNLPGLSWAFSRWLGEFSDGFAEVGRGFGYSYPAQRMVWMRIDRILAGSRFRFLDAATISPRISDHLAVTADLELRPDRR